MVVVGSPMVVGAVVGILIGLAVVSVVVVGVLGIVGAAAVFIQSIYLIGPLFEPFFPIIQIAFPIVHAYRIS